MTDLSSERNHVVLTERKYLNILHDYKFIMVLMEHRSIDQISDVFFIPFGEEKHGTRVSLGGLTEPFPVRILAYALKDSPHRPRQLLDAFFCLLWGRLEPFSGSRAYNMEHYINIHPFNDENQAQTNMAN